MSRKLLLALLLVLAGLAILVVSAIPEAIGLAGSKPRARAEFGWKQIVGVLVGVVVLLGGLLVARRATKADNLQ